MILVSACLAGVPCRWNGEAKTDWRVVELVRQGKAIPACPEQLGGLPTPREPAESRDGAVVTRSGVDVSGNFERGAETFLALAERFGCGEAILKARSPSCGCGSVYDGSFTGRVVPGDGVAAARLRARGVRLRTEEDPRP